MHAMPTKQLSLGLVFDTVTIFLQPLYIPPHVNAIGFPSRLRSPRLWDPCSEISCKGLSGGSTSPPPYTPPPMLSPLRSGSGLFWHVLSGPRSAGPTTPHTAATPRGELCSYHYRRKFCQLTYRVCPVEAWPVLLIKWQTMSDIKCFSALRMSALNNATSSTSAAGKLI